MQELIVPVAACTPSPSCFIHRRLRARAMGSAGRNGVCGQVSSMYSRITFDSITASRPLTSVGTTWFGFNLT